ncbi:MAG TPA: hypothetical protein VGJ84_00670, partial [Polyangiaceae bacterium]
EALPGVVANSYIAQLARALSEASGPWSQSMGGDPETDHARWVKQLPGEHLGGDDSSKHRPEVAVDERPSNRDRLTDIRF